MLRILTAAFLLGCATLSQSSDEQCEGVDPDCAVIELAIINGPSRFSLYQSLYPEEWDAELRRDTLRTVSFVNEHYRNTEWKMPNEPAPFICFNIVVGRIVNLQDWGSHAPTGETPGDYLTAIRKYVEAEMQTSAGWSFDSTQAIFHVDFGRTGGLGYMPSRSCAAGPDYRTALTTSFWSPPAWGLQSFRAIADIMAHELGHNLGISHDQDCPEDDFGHVMGYAGALDPHTTALNFFSDCSIRQLRTAYDDSGFSCMSADDLDCDRIIPFAVCGNGIIEGAEECDGSECCDENCRLEPICCPADGTFDCLKVENEGEFGGHEWGGYYSACIGRGNDAVTAVYSKHDVYNDRSSFTPLYLQQSDDEFMIWDETTEQSISSGFSVSNEPDRMKCYDLLDNECDESLFGQFPLADITITGSVRYSYLNGKYTNDGSCHDGKPDYVNGFVHLRFNPTVNQWQLFHEDSNDFKFAFCNIPELEGCVEGTWNVDTPHDNEHSFSVDVQMKVNFD